MLSEYQLKITNLCYILIGNVKRLVPNFFNKEKFTSSLKLVPLLETRIKTIKNTSRIRI